jgi:hypothetical protein
MNVMMIVCASLHPAVVIVDPPQGYVAYKVDWDKKPWDRNEFTYLFDLLAVSNHHPDTVLFIYCSPHQLALLMELGESKGWHYNAYCVWHKLGSYISQLGRMVTNATELIYMACKSTILPTTWHLPTQCPDRSNCFTFGATTNREKGDDGEVINLTQKSIYMVLE